MAELSEADVQFVKELRQAKEEGRISRRDALKVAGALGLGGVVGGAGGASMFGTAAGGASTSDSDGNVGLPGDRVDVFAEGIDGKTATIDELTSMTEFFTPSDGKFHSVDESTFRSLLDNYQLIVTPAGDHSNPPGVTMTSTKTLTKADHDNTEVICPTENPSTRAFEIKPSGDFPAFDWTEDIGGLTFSGLWFNGANLAGTTDLLTIGDGYLLRLEKCLFDGGGRRGFTSTGSLHSSTVTDCRFNTFADAGLAITGATERVFITDNYFGETLSDKGIYVSTSQTVTALIARNTVSLTGGVGIRTSGGGPDPRLVITDNIVRNAGGIGIQAGGPTVKGNTVVKAAGSCGIRATHVIGNVVALCDGNGIEATGDDQILGNLVFNNDQGATGAVGIDVNFDDNSYIAWNHIEDTQTTATQEYGIQIASSNDVVIGPNFISGHATGDINDGGARTVFGGQGGLYIGQNAGSPASGGDWNGNGRRGVIVEDTNNAGDAYIYLPGAGAWSQIAT